MTATSAIVPAPHLLTSAECYARYGDPTLRSTEAKCMELVDLASKFPTIYTLPRRLYVNRDFWPILSSALNNVQDSGLQLEIRTWDGCFNVRRKRGARSWSLHAWGLAIDINAAWNQFGKKPTMSKELVDCFVRAGCHWGGYWAKPDGMHFQLAKLPTKSTKS